MEFHDALKDFLEAQGITLADLKGSIGLVPEPNSDEPATDKPNKVVVIDKTNNSNRSYRRLRLFSGRTPTPTGKLDFENWRRLAKQLLKDISISDTEKRSRVTESLVPPALDVWAIGEGSSADDYLDCLSKAYGSTADGDELLTTFRCEYQNEGKKVSEYLLRLHTMLTRVMEADGAKASSGSKLLCSQFQRGCLYNDPLLHTLQLQTRRADPPSMLELLREVRTAETQLEEKLGRRTPKKSPSKVSVMEQSVTTTLTRSAPAPTVANDVDELRQAVDRLHQRLDGLFKAQSNPRHRYFPSNTGALRRNSVNECTLPKNPTLVQEKMMARFTKATEAKGSGNDSGQL